MTAQARRTVPPAAPPGPRHFLDIDGIDPAALRGILEDSVALKRQGRNTPKRLQGFTLALMFEKPSTRTRVSFEVAMRQLGGDVLLLDPAQSQLGRGESIADTARVLSRYVDAVMMRTDDPGKLREFADHATVPVINGLTDASHPCQLMADVMTVEEHRGPISGQAIAWVGDGNNMAASWIQGATAFGYELRLACPDQLPPPADEVTRARREGARIEVTTDPEAGVAGVDVVVADTWVSMGDKDAANRHNVLKPYQVDSHLMGIAKPDALFMHCLPAHRGEEVTAEIIDGPQSVVWDEAENRLHAQKGILSWCLAELIDSGEA
ncbi:MAG: ornithine carbamoyltransferase [Alphaproteobacteria bacterium]|nr:ornithine carbamoyltransferase [Alphaproteobacteria bacterium]